MAEKSSERRRRREAGLRKCSKCQETKDLDEFHANARTCKGCFSYKTNRMCTACGQYRQLRFFGRGNSTCNRCRLGA